MPGPYEVIFARVMQKVATEADWLAVEDELGVILAGEQAFVLDPTGTFLVNFKIGDGTKKFSELPYFITYYSNVLNQKILTFTGTTDITIPSVFRDKSCLYDVIVINSSGSVIDLKLGTSSGGNELYEVTVPIGTSTINSPKVFSTPTTLYLSGLAGKSYTIFIVYFQYDESPATPPTGGGGGSSGGVFPRCFKGMFEPLNDTDLDTNWDFTTGLGKTGTPYANCAISGTNGTEDMGRFYPVGWQVGDSLRPATTFGNSSGLITIAENNIPEHRHKLFSGAAPIGQLAPDTLGNKVAAWSSNHTSGNQDYDMKQAGDGNASIGTTSAYGQATPDAIDIRPKSKIVLYFVAITDP